MAELEDLSSDRTLLAEQILRLSDELGVGPKMRQALLDVVYDRSIPLEHIESLCDRVVAERVEADALPWSPTGNPRCVLTAKRH